jgi:hypothetical protein
MILLIMVIVVQISATRMGPVVSTQMKRDREKQLVFILREFKRSIDRFKKFNRRSPSSMDELVKSPHPRYLRRIYIDPMTGKAEWDLDMEPSGVGIREIRSKSRDKSIAGVEYWRWRLDDRFELILRPPAELGGKN